MLRQPLEVMGRRVRIRLHADRPCDGRMRREPSHTVLVVFDRDVAISVPAGGQLADVPIRTRFFSVDELVPLGEPHAVPHSP